MHNLLAIETSEETCSAALRTGGDCMELFESEPRKHSELILPMIDRLMAEAGLQRGSLDAVAFGRGPIDMSRDRQYRPDHVKQNQQ